MSGDEERPDGDGRGRRIEDDDPLDQADERAQDDGYADVTLPGEAGNGTADRDDDDEIPVPPEVREPLLRDRARERLGVSLRQWYVIESFLLVLPYPFFVLVYLTVDVNETLFLLVTGAYSLAAMYVGFLS